MYLHINYKLVYKDYKLWRWDHTCKSKLSQD